MSPATVGLILTALTALGGFLGVVLSGIGKRGDQKATKDNDQYTRMMGEITYWQATATTARTQLDACLTELNRPDRPTM
jgi:hypothetical protein